MRAAIAGARRANLAALFLLGSPKYYPRFGFVRYHIQNEYGATDAFMHLEVEPGSLQAVQATARYVRAFGESLTS